jgi:hypothetical protein
VAVDNGLMTTMETETPEGAPDRTNLRRDYEANVIPITTLCETYRISRRGLYYLADQQGWRLRNPRRIDKSDLIERMLRLIEAQTETLETTMVNSPKGNEAVVLNKLATTLDKLISLQAAQAPKRLRRDTKTVEDIRRKVAERLAELNAK